MLEKHSLMRGQAGASPRPLRGAIRASPVAVRAPIGVRRTVLARAAEEDPHKDAPANQSLEDRIAAGEFSDVGSTKERLTRPLRRLLAQDPVGIGEVWGDGHSPRIATGRVAAAATRFCCTRAHTRAVLLARYHSSHTDSLTWRILHLVSTQSQQCSSPKMGADASCCSPRGRCLLLPTPPNRVRTPPRPTHPNNPPAGRWLALQLAQLGRQWRAVAAKRMPEARGDIREIVGQPVFVPLYRLAQVRGVCVERGLARCGSATWRSCAAGGRCAPWCWRRVWCSRGRRRVGG